jgi:PKD repeat protein
MGALTFTWMGYEDLEITACDWTWAAPGSRTVKITVDNTGTKDVTINHIEVNHLGVANTAVTPEPPFVFKTTDVAKDLTITYDYTNGSSYDIAVVTSGGHEFTDHFTGGQDET